MIRDAQVSLKSQHKSWGPSTSLSTLHNCQYKLHKRGGEQFGNRSGKTNHERYHESKINSENTERLDSKTNNKPGRSQNRRDNKARTDHNIAIRLKDSEQTFSGNPSQGW